MKHYLRNSWLINTFLALLVCYSFGHSELRAQNNTSPSVLAECSNSCVDIILNLVATDKSKLTFELTLKNKDTQSYFVMVNPSQIDGTRGPYVIADKETQGMLNVSFYLHSEPNGGTPFINRSSLELVKMLPEKPLTEQFSIPLPFSRTIPPYDVGIIYETKITQPIFTIRAFVGLLPASPVVNDALSRKPRGNMSINGLETIFIGPEKGQPLAKLQRICTSNVVNLKDALEHLSHEEGKP